MRIEWSAPEVLGVSSREPMFRRRDIVTSFGRDGVSEIRVIPFFNVDVVRFGLF